MPRGGRQPGAGRPLGAKGKATIERELQAARQVALRPEQRETALQKMDRIASLCEGAASVTRPVAAAEMANG